MAEKIKILIIDKDPTRRGLLKRLLENKGVFDCNVIPDERADEILHRPENFDPSGLTLEKIAGNGNEVIWVNGFEKDNLELLRTIKNEAERLRKGKLFIYGDVKNSNEDVRSLNKEHIMAIRAPFWHDLEEIVSSICISVHYLRINTRQEIDSARSSE